jgi:hypothetical protein
LHLWPELKRLTQATPYLRKIFLFDRPINKFSGQRKIEKTTLAYLAVYANLSPQFFDNPPDNG